jgi:hypothetical protein
MVFESNKDVVIDCVDIEDTVIIGVIDGDGIDVRVDIKDCVNEFDSDPYDVIVGIIVYVVVDDGIIVGVGIDVYVFESDPYDVIVGIIVYVTYDVGDDVTITECVSIPVNTELKVFINEFDTDTDPVFEILGLDEGEIDEEDDRDILVERVNILVDDAIPVFVLVDCIVFD